MQQKALLVTALAAGLLAASGCSTKAAVPAAAKVAYFPSPGGGNLPFSEAVRAGDFLFLSGEIGRRPGTTELVPGGLPAEARQAMENVKANLERHGATLDDVVKCTVFIADMKDWGAFNEVYRTFFTKSLPARSALGASGLALGARVEVECLAVVPPPPPR